jgi:LuxR family maltose regulon positive regulatory protein
MGAKPTSAPDPALRLKSTPPRTAKWLIAREQISLTRPEFGDTPVLCVIAQSGFGKTSLLSQWRREWLARGTVVAWLTLDQNDDVARFSTGLATAMDMASGRRVFARIGRRPLVTGGGVERVTEWLAEVADLGAECALILDEIDCLPVATVQQSLRYLLSHLPANLQVALASRTRLELPVADLVAHGLLKRIGPDSLRFTLAETIAVLQTRFGANLDADACARLHDLTEGWPLGLQLAIATIEKGSNPREMLDSVSARAGDIRRYFVESLMARLSAPARDFLTRIAVVDRVHPSLCRALTGHANASGLLEELRATTPIFMEDNESEWSNINPLAREFLLECCEQLPTSERKSLHATAAEWFAAHGRYEEAARHALQAGQTESAWELVERGLFDLFSSGHAARVLEWVDRLPPSEIEKRPRLLLTVGWLRATSPRHAEAAPLAQRALESPRLEPSDQLLAMLMLSAALFHADAIDEARAIAEKWRAQLADDASKSYHRGANQLALLALYDGNPAAARMILQRGMLASPGFVIDYAGGVRAVVEGLSHLWEGQVVLAERVLSEAHSRAQSLAGRRGAVTAIIAGSLALALFEQNETDRAAALVANHLDVVEQIAMPDALIASYVVSARLAAHRGEERRAHSLLEALHTIGEMRRIPRLSVVALAEMIRIHAREDRAETTAALLARLEDVSAMFPLADRGTLGGLLQLHVAMATAHAAVACRCWDRLEQALEHANRLATRMRRGREAIEIKLLQALRLRSTGESGEAAMTEALSLVEAYGLKRIVSDTHPTLEEWAGELGSGKYAVVASKAQPPYNTDMTRAATRVSPSALLTTREQEVLGLLARRLSNKQIAAALDIGDATIKWHLKNLFAKLGAVTREHAVQRARMLGILAGM